MKVLTSALALLLCLTLNAQNAPKKTKKSETVVFAVEMHCGSCKKRIENNISFEKGVKDLQADLSAQTVTIKYDKKKTTPETLQQAIIKLGYRCEIEASSTDSKAISTQE